jgi:hypothetical protein
VAKQLGAYRGKTEPRDSSPGIHALDIAECVRAGREAPCGPVVAMPLDFPEVVDTFASTAETSSSRTRHPDSRPTGTAADSANAVDIVGSRQARARILAVMVEAWQTSPEYSPLVFAWRPLTA